MASLSKKNKHKLLATALALSILTPITSKAEPFSVGLAAAVGVAAANSLIDNVIMPVMNSIAKFEADLNKPVNNDRKKHKKRSTWLYYNVNEENPASGIYARSFGQKVEDFGKSNDEKILIEMMVMKDYQSKTHTFISAKEGFTCSDGCYISMKTAGGDWQRFLMAPLIVNGLQTLYPVEQERFLNMLTMNYNLNVSIPQHGQYVEYYFTNRNLNVAKITPITN